MTLKSVLVLVANRQVGYTVAHVATDLRLSFIRSLLSARWEYYLRQPVGALANSLATEATRGAESYLYGATVIALVHPGARLLDRRAARVVAGDAGRRSPRAPCSSSC